MAQTIDDIQVNEDWQSVSVLTGYAVGIGMAVQFKGSTETVLLSEGTQPAADSIKGAYIDRSDPVIELDAGSDEFWIRCENGSATVHVGEL